MLFSMSITLYTSRVVLQTLGAVDFGIYGVVGGVLAMFTFINGSMASSTSRFLNFELGKGNKDKLRDTFCVALIVHFLIAAVCVLLCETIGTWFIVSKLQIPIERIEAACWVFQFAIASMFVSVIQVPFSASIMSHEKMEAYAFLEILHSLLQLGIVFILVMGDFDKLKLYSVLMFLVALLIMVSYLIYCRKNFSECRFRFVWDKTIIIPMISFSGWSLYGNLAEMARTQGVNILLNIFFGPVLNAAAEIANRIKSVTMRLSNNFSVAIQPQIVQEYAVGNHMRVLSLMRIGAKLSFLLMLFLSMPLMIEMHFILTLWLGVIPDHVEILCILTLLWNLGISMIVTFDMVSKATGHIKRPTFLMGSIAIMVIPFSYFAYRMGAPYWTPFLYNVISLFLVLWIYNPIFSKYIEGYSFFRMILPDYLKNWIVLVLVGIISFVPHLFLNEGIVRLLLTCVVSSLFTCILGCFIVLPKEIRKKIFNRIIKIS